MLSFTDVKGSGLFRENVTEMREELRRNWWAEQTDRRTVPTKRLLWPSRCNANSAQTPVSQGCVVVCGTPLRNNTTKNESNEKAKQENWLNRENQLTAWLAEENRKQIQSSQILSTELPQTVSCYPRCYPCSSGRGMSRQPRAAPIWHVKGESKACF